MAEKRLLGNWLQGFLDWTMPRSETPESMLKWVGLFTLASVKKRKVYWPQELMGGYTIFPNLYVVLVGEPAVVRKSTTIGFAEKIISQYNELTDGFVLNPVNFSGDVTSHSKLLDGLANSGDSSLSVVSGEFSSLIQTTPEQMYELLTDIFDNKQKFEWSTWAHGDKSIKEPVVNLLAATTPAWISKQPPEYFVGGGFASRILFLYEEGPRELEIFYDHVDQAKIKSLQVQLSNDLGIIAGFEGAFTFDTKGTKEFIRSWYKSQDASTADTRLKGYYGRKHVHALKIAGLLSMCERSDLKVTQAHWEEAIKLLDYIERRMGNAFSTLGQNTFAVMMDGILDYIEAFETRTMTEIAGRFYREGITLDQLKSSLAFLCTGGKIVATGKLENPTYRFKER